MDKILDQVLAASLGLAVGDTLGSQTEFNKKIVVSGMANTWMYDFPAFSDDTQNFLALIDALLVAPPHENAEEFMHRFGDFLIKQAEGYYGMNDRSPGSTCMKAVVRIRHGFHWTESGIKNGKGNGSVMRVAAVGLAYWKDPQFAFKLGGLTSLISHNSMDSVMASAALAHLMALLLHGFEYGPAVAETLKVIESMDKTDIPYWNEIADEDREFAVERLRAAHQMSSASSGTTLKEWREFNGNDGKAVEALAAAIFYNCLYDNYSDIVLGTANNTIDSDTTSAIAGAIAGARFGLSGIPAEWLQQVEKSTLLHGYATKLYLFGAHVPERQLDLLVA